MSSGPVFGSVAWPVAISPKLWPSTQMAAAMITARTRTGRTAAGTKTPTAMIAKRTARPIVTAVLWVPISEPALRSIEPIQPGSPSAPPAIVARSAPDAWLAARSRKYAPLPHRASHAIRARRLPRGLPAATLPPSTARRGGQARTAIRAYSTAPPGAPVIGDAALVKTPPRPSPSHQISSPQTMLPASAARTAGRHSSPAARASWMVANRALNATSLCSISCPANVTGCATKPGLPAPAGSMTCAGNARLNMYGWYCRAASSSQMTPRAI